MTKNKKRGWFRSTDDDREKEESAPDPHVSSDPQPSHLSPVPEAAAPPVSRPASEIDVVTIFDAAGVSREDRDRVERARTLLHALPRGVSAEVRRQIVETALTTFGIATDRIVEAARKETAALEGFISSSQTATDKQLEENRARVRALEQEIIRLRQTAEQAAAAHTTRIRAANTEMLGVQEVLAFFGSEAAGMAEVDLVEEPTEERSSWAVHLPIPAPPSRTGRTSKPPPLRPPEPPAPAAAPSSSTPPGSTPSGSTPSGSTPSGGSQT